MAVFVDVSDTRQGFDVGFTYDAWQADVESAIDSLPGMLEYMVNNEPSNEYFNESEGWGNIDWDGVAGIWFEATASTVKEMDVWGPGVRGFGFMGSAVPNESLDWLLSFDAKELWIEGEQHSLAFRGDVSVNPDTLTVSGSVKNIFLGASNDLDNMDGKYVMLSGSIAMDDDDWAGSVSKMEWGTWVEEEVAGEEEFVFTAAGSVSVKVDASALQETLEANGFDGLMGSALGGNDSITGTAGADYLDAANGNDKVFGLAGNDRIYGGAGNDKLDGGEGDDDIEGGEGNDAITDLSGNNNVVDIEGNAKVTTGSGNDSIEVGDGNAKIVADGGDNTVSAGNGNNNVVSGSGDDDIELGNGNNKVVAGDGDNTVNVGNGNNNLVTGAGSDFIEAGDGKNKIVSGTGDDSVSAGAGGDNIKTDLGADEVNAGAGKNIIDLGADTDSDTVHFGADFFAALLDLAPAFNQLKNFNMGDVLAFDNSLGLLAEEVLISDTASISDAAAYHLVFNTSTGKLYYDADGTGSGQAAMQIGLVKGAALGGEFDLAMDGGSLTIGSVLLD